ncbi:MAG: hypothetical protein ACNS60_05965 [Candidatus Cyclobacteriaceae bacterium M2_1C_046]
MSQFLIRLLHSNKYLFPGLLVLVISCKSVNTDNGSLPEPSPYLYQENSSLIYNATFDYKEFHASGLLVMKKVEKESYHVVLLSKFGVTLMEFKINPDGMTWIKKFEQLDRRSVEKLIAKDFHMLLLLDLFPPTEKKLVFENDLYVTYKLKEKLPLHISVSKSQNHVMALEEKGFLKPVKTTITFGYREKDVPEQVTIKHSNIKLEIKLDLLKVNYAEE